MRNCTSLQLIAATQSRWGKKGPPNKTSPPCIPSTDNQDGPKISGSRCFNAVPKTRRRVAVVSWWTTTDVPSGVHNKTTAKYRNESSGGLTTGHRWHVVLLIPAAYQPYSRLISSLWKIFKSTTTIASYGKSKKIILSPIKNIGNVLYNVKLSEVCHC